MKSAFAIAAYVSAVLAQAPSLTDLIQSQPDLSTLGTVLGLVPDLAETVTGLSDITILAPTNSAFEALLAQVGEGILNDTGAVASILAYHVLNGTFTSSDFSEVPTYVNSLFVPSLSGTFTTNVTEGQNVGLVLDGENALILSGLLQSATVTQAVRV